LTRIGDFIGDFVEIHASDEAHMKQIIDKLEYDENDKIVNSYVEI